MAKKKTLKLIVKRGTDGLGLFAGEEIHRGDFILPYIGEIITNKEADRRGGRYLFEINRYHTIDGKGRNNFARHINHSCEPNCFVEVDKKRETLEIYARKGIQPGEELYYNYGKQYFKEIIGGAKGCKCRMHRTRRKEK